MRTFSSQTWLAGFALAALVMTGCTVEKKSETGGAEGSGTKSADTASADAGDLKVEIDGSSTVYPISSAVGEVFMDEDSARKVNVGRTGTGGGFKRFVTGETDISDASRPIKPAEAEQAKENGVEYAELKVAIDGLSVVVHPENPVSSITTEQLKEIWKSDSTVKKWSDVDASWPEEEIKLYGPDTESGTYDYFVEEILGKKNNPRTDYIASSDDNVLLQGVAGDKFALGYFGYSYYVNNKDKVKALAIGEGDAEPVAPTKETIEGGTYTPLARPLFIYVNKAKAAERAVLKDYLKLYVSDTGQELVAKVGYVALNPEALAELRAAVNELVGE